AHLSPPLHPSRNRQHTHGVLARHRLKPSAFRGCLRRLWPHRAQIPISQREFWDRQLRRSESYAEKWEYVVNNPVRHGYVPRDKDWPYQGELFVLEWHDR